MPKHPAVTSESRAGPTADREWSGGLGGVAGGVVHHLGELASVIVGHTQLLLCRQHAPATLAALRKIEAAAREVAATVRALARATAQSPSRPQLALVDLNETIRAAAGHAMHYWNHLACRRGRPVEIALELEDVPPVSGDPMELDYLVTALLLNSCKAMPEGGRLRVHTSADPSNVTLTLQSTNSSAGQQSLPLQLSTGRDDEAASPVARDGDLHACKEIAAHHGGCLLIEAVTGHQATVMLTLPRAQECAFCAPVPAATPAAVRARLLLVDDEEPLLDTIKEAVCLGGFQADVAASGEAALQALNTNTYDLVVTDLGMPRINGARVAEAAKSLNPALPVIILTGWGQQMRPDEARHCDLVLNKPVSLEDLLDAINRTLSGI